MSCCITQSDSYSQLLQIMPVYYVVLGACYHAGVILNTWVICFNTYLGAYMNLLASPEYSPTHTCSHSELLARLVTPVVLQNPHIN